jgi:hypothetical protein
MKMPFSNRRGIARWIAILASALGIQLGLCTITPLALTFVFSSSDSVSDFWGYLPVVQGGLFIATFVALVIALLVNLIHRILAWSSK